ncbi:mitochondrial import inner membrane translocase, subunit timm23 [Balamuthia mandrillaris]
MEDPTRHEAPATDDLNFPKYDYSNEGLANIGDQYNVSIDLETSNPMLAVSAPQGAEYIYEGGPPRRKVNSTDRFQWIVGSSFLIGGLLGGIRALPGTLRALYPALRGRAPLRTSMATASNVLMSNRGLSLAPKLAGFGVIYSGSEVLISVMRRKEDRLNYAAAITAAPIIFFSSSHYKSAMAGIGGVIAASLFIWAHKRDLGDLQTYFPVSDQAATGDYGFHGEHAQGGLASFS